MNRKFYKKVITKNINDKNNSILVVAGGKNDFEILKELNYSNVTISNLDERILLDDFRPYKWSLQDAEILTFCDNKFDYVLVNMGLHHCFSPHKALLEMYRVAKKGVICIENRDSYIMKILVKLNFCYQYEFPAVYFNEFLYGGVGNSEIPNYIYRWSENEINKTINCFAPYSKHKIYFYYGLNIPKRLNKKILLKYLLIIIGNFLKVFFPKQLNLFAFFIKKPDLNSELLPWLKVENKSIKVNKIWLKDNWAKIINI